MNCRICRAKTQPIISFGRMPQANGFLAKRNDPEHFFTLTIVFCPQCFMVQLAETLEAKIMFGDDYHFISSTSTVMLKHFKKIATDIWQMISKKKQPFVIELGSNDGIMLKHLAKRKVLHLGVEPAANVANLARKNGVNVLESFFSLQTAEKIRKHHGPADVICGSNVFCHIENLSSVFAGIRLLLKNDGVAFFEDPYLLDIIRKTSFDQMYDEHVYYFSGLAVQNLAKQHGLYLTDMRHQPVHGGSMRYYLSNNPLSPVSKRVRYWLSQERKLQLHHLRGFSHFQQKVDKISFNLKVNLLRLKKRGYQIVGYGATSKSTTILNYAKIGPHLLRYICDTTPTKICTFSPGTHIPIKAHTVFVKDNPPYTLLLAWNHQKEIFAKEARYRKRGGKFITYFPKITVQ